MRRRVVNHLLAQRPKGRRPHLQVIVDLTCLPKRGKFKQLGSLIRVFKRKRGLHLLVLDLVVGSWRLPWNWRIYRGKGELTQVQLALRMIRTLPRRLRQHYQLIILADSTFGSSEFLHQIRRLNFHAVVGTTKRRTLAEGCRITQLRQPEQQHYLNGMKVPVYVAWYWLKRDDGTRVKRFVLSTRRLKQGAIYFWGRRRWQIEGWFKTAKHRFGLHRFGQSTLRGVYRYLLVCMIAFVLAHWASLLASSPATLDWGHAARDAFEIFLPLVALAQLLFELERLRPLALNHGISLQAFGARSELCLPH
ncbi:MAG: transposase [Synechococcus sp.]